MEIAIGSANTHQYRPLKHGDGGNNESIQVTSTNITISDETQTLETTRTVTTTNNSSTVSSRNDIRSCNCSCKYNFVFCFDIINSYVNEKKQRIYESCVCLTNIICTPFLIILFLRTSHAPIYDSIYNSKRININQPQSWEIGQCTI